MATVEVREEKRGSTPVHNQVGEVYKQIGQALDERRPVTIPVKDSVASMIFGLKKVLIGRLEDYGGVLLLSKSEETQTPAIYLKWSTDPEIAKQGADDKGIRREFLGRWYRDLFTAIQDYGKKKYDRIDEIYRVSARALGISPYLKPSDIHFFSNEPPRNEIHKVIGRARKWADVIANSLNEESELGYIVDDDEASEFLQYLYEMIEVTDSRLLSELEQEGMSWQKAREAVGVTQRGG